MCSCQSSDATTATKAVEGRDFVVTGMTCGSCAAKVTAAARAVPGVTGVEVDLTTGRLTVAGTAAEADITAAVTGAGYPTARP